jgi:myo-inositol-1(or 4)-monophosphatase
MSPRARPAEAPLIEPLRRLAEHAAWIGGECARRAFGRRTRVRYKPDQSEVTAADLAAQRGILRFLRRRRPGDCFLGEEGVVRAAPRRSAVDPESAVWWIVDPLDGTRNFVRGLGAFACSVAALRHGRPIAGAIYEPLRETLYSAGLRLGATRNGRPLRRIAARTTVEKSATRRLLIAVPSVRDKPGAALVRRAFDQHIVRNFGAAALHLAMVADGALDAAIMNQCKLWDISAGAALLREVGAELVDLDGAPVFPLAPDDYAGANIPCVAAGRGALRRLKLR